MIKKILPVASFIIVIALFTNAYSQQSQPDDLKVQGIKLLNEKNYKAAEKTLQSYVKQVKDDSDGWYYLGIIKHRLLKVKDAKKALVKALDLKPDNPAILSLLAYLEVLSGDFKFAATKAETALKLDDSNIDALYVLGYVRFRDGENIEAKSYVQKLLKLNEKHAPGWLLLSEICVNDSASKFLSAPLKGENKSSEPLTDEMKKEQIEASKKRRSNLKDAADALETYLKYSDGKSNRDFWIEQLESLRIHSGINRFDSVDQTVISGFEADSMVKITYKEKAKYTVDALDNRIEGVVVLRGIFHKDGTLKHILVLKGLPMGLTENAITAAKKIKFTPAIKKGKFVSMVTNIQFVFSRF